MKKAPLLYHILVLVVILLVMNCATPVAPQGGPRDSAGPVVLKTEPETGTTNFEGNSITFSFDEFVNRSSVPGNVTIEPDLGLGYSLDWRRKSLTIKFEDDLPDSTTIIVTLGAEVSDTKSNQIGSPIKVAFSTGDEIDEGKVMGRIRDAETGKGVESATVLLYRTPIDLTRRANYKAQTDTGGVFQFSYLREGDYQAIYLDDRNRNKTWEQSSETAQPFFRERIRLADQDADTLNPIYVVREDTLAPKLQAVGMFSSNRLRFRFDENIRLSEQVSIQVKDSSENPFSTAFPLYVSKKDPFVLFAHSDEPTDPGSIYSVDMDGVTDAAGNSVITKGVTFQGSAQEDTTLQRIIESETKNGLYPTQSFELTYAAPITDPMIIDSLVIAEGELTFTEWPTIRTKGNKLFIDPQEASWIEGVDYQFLVWSPSTMRRKLYNPEIWDFTELGELEVVVQDSDSSSNYNLTLENEDISFRFDTTFSQRTIISDLAPVEYQVRVYEDLNGNSRWDQGSVIPFMAPEPYFIQNGISIRTGFTSEVIIKF